MADLATQLIRTTVRAFYPTNPEYTLVVDALVVHGTLSDNDLASILGMQTKQLRRICGKLKEDGLLDVHARGEKKDSTFTSSQAHHAFKERVFYRDWYYLNHWKSIDSVKYKLWRLSRHIESLGAPTTEKKDLVCPQCKSSYTELETLDNIDMQGNFLCHRCGHILDSADDDQGQNENESMKKLNVQLSHIVGLMRKIDSTNVPEHDFDMSLAHSLPIARSDYNPARQGITHVEDKAGLESSKGLQLAPETIEASVLEDSDIPKVDPNEAALKREQEAQQNALPSWISKSTISGDITRVGAKEQAERAARDAHHAGLALNDTAGDEKKVRDGDSAVMDEYWKALKAEQERERLEQEAEDEDDDEDDDEFEDVDVGIVAANPPPAAATPNSGMVSSTATDDEDAARTAKKVKFETSQSNGTINAPLAASAEDTKDAVSDEDDLDFEDV
ncbi:hypothetical protein MBLNU459_g5747t1 [Dothideomycetes sp. NU459]